MSPPHVPVVIKKYANRRLYDTDRSTYITLDSLAAMVKEDRPFVVLDARTGDDITRGVLAQVILEEETKGRAMLPVPFLRQLIRWYGDSRQDEVSEYLERMMNEFIARQAHASPELSSALGAENAEIIGQVMSMFTSLHAVERGVGSGPSIESLVREVMDLRAELQHLRGGTAGSATPQAGDGPA
ncbi:polyhydroxyalkanoate synthesis repressor PhaR [Novacetimonas maltaceti]|uniref:PHB/PHA accumulation regulator DNA-binding domain protein n=1 Tax=Novacetimonas maltaceti TaxID=1203393 RepID=A0A2S3VXU2_9PROT|nr:polyhydroxyalkanoate synthesis repressor PhaR [Novacetimonas maltaceti]POF61431.1 PHB/PHA accumulation regulator DNA-binding domain protein [Novacetimonas maltaceti]